MAWADSYLPALSALDDSPPGSDIRFFRPIREQVDALREAINRRAICVWAQPSLGYLEIPAWSGPPLVVSASQINDCRNMVKLMMEDYGTSGSASGDIQRRFLDTSIYPYGDIEGHDPGDPPYVSKFPAEAITLAGLKASIPIGDGADFTNIPARNTWGLSAAYAQTLSANTPRFKEHLNELHSLMLAMPYAIFGSSNFKGYAIGVSPFPYGSDVGFKVIDAMGGKWPNIQGTRARLYIRIKDHPNWVTSAVARDGLFHYVEDVAMGTALTSSFVATYAAGSPPPVYYIVGAIVVDME